MVDISSSIAQMDAISSAVDSAYARDMADIRKWLLGGLLQPGAELAGATIHRAVSAFVQSLRARVGVFRPDENATQRFQDASAEWKHLHGQVTQLIGEMRTLSTVPGRTGAAAEAYSDSIETQIWQTENFAKMVKGMSEVYEQLLRSQRQGVEGLFAILSGARVSCLQAGGGLMPFSRTLRCVEVLKGAANAFDNLVKHSAQQASQIGTRASTATTLDQLRYVLPFPGAFPDPSAVLPGAGE